MELVTVTPDGKEHTLPMLQQHARRLAGSAHARRPAPLDFYARSGRSRSRIGRLEVQMTPQILSTKVRITPPAYTKRPAYEGAIPKDGITGLAGTNVEFTVTSNRPLRDGRLAHRVSRRRRQIKYHVHAPGDSLRKWIAPAEPTTVQGTIELKKPGTFQHLSVFDIDGLESLDRVSGTITIAVDQRPVVRILATQAAVDRDARHHACRSRSPPKTTYGITSLQLYRSLNGSPRPP